MLIYEIRSMGRKKMYFYLGIDAIMLSFCHYKKSNFIFYAIDI